MDIKNNILKYETIVNAKGARLIAVSKTHPAEKVMEAYVAGHRMFGENKVQELVSKYEVMPKDIEWHMIGHLQSNKVKYIGSFVSLIHGVDSLKLLEEIDKQGRKNNRIISCLLQVHIATEETKFGFDKNEITDLLKKDLIQNLKFINIRGLMGMASLTDDQEKIREEFRGLKIIFEGLRSHSYGGNISMQELSMGMSADYMIALEEGSTMVRIGSAIFGGRINLKI